MSRFHFVHRGDPSFHQPARRENLGYVHELGRRHEIELVGLSHPDAPLERMLRFRHEARAGSLDLVTDALTLFSWRTWRDGRARCSKMATGTRVMLKALGIACLLLETALSQTTSLPSSFQAAETQRAESPHANRPGAPGTIDGVVTDSSGSVVMGALVTLGSTASTGKRTTVTNEAGSFHFAAVAPGNYTITIVADGFEPWIAACVLVREGESQRPRLYYRLLPHPPSWMSAYRRRNSRWSN